MKIYDLVKDLLVKHPGLRDSDQLLIWNVWGVGGYLIDADYGRRTIDKSTFLQATHPESITRARRMVQQDFPYLRSSREIQKAKDKKEAEKGTFAYRENV